MRDPTPLPYDPQVFFWIAEYVDGSIVSQFDLDDGHENLFKNVDQSRLRSFGWYPVTPKLAALVKDQVLRVVPFLPKYRLMLGPDRKLIAHRQGHIKHDSAIDREIRWTIYVLGYEDQNGKHTICIDANGNAQIG